MKKMNVIMMTCLLWYSQLETKAQPGDNKTITPHLLTVAYSKTTNLIFPYAIISVDRGSKDVLVQKAKGVENILQVKAARESFPQTNLTVVTADGKLTSFVVDYTDQPDVLNMAVNGDKVENNISLPSETINQQEVQEDAKKVFESGEGTKKITDRSFGVSMELNGVFVHENVLYLRLDMTNRTHINYDIDQFRLYIRDQKKAKRTASQEIEIIPVSVYQHPEKINGNTEHRLVLAVPKFTIPDKKYLAIQMMEKNGGRHLELHVKNKNIVKAIPIK